MSGDTPRKGSGNKARARARRLALQALYQWQIAGQDLAVIEEQFLTEQDFSRADRDYFATLLHGVPAEIDTLDAKVAPALSRPIEEVDPVERALLRLATFELLHHIEIPYRVVINEAVELAKTFGAEQGHKFINGVLDKLARELRAIEMQAQGKG